MPSDESRSASPSRSGGGNGPQSMRGKLVLTSGDVRELYETARALGGMGGAPYLNRLYDAASALDHGQLDRVQQILSRTRQEFEKAHTRLLRFSPESNGDRKKQREDARLGAKKQQVEEVLGHFDAHLAVVERMIDVAERAAAPPAAADSPPSGMPHDDDLPADFAREYQAEQKVERQLAVVERHFALEAIAKAGDLLPDSLYFLRTRASGYLLRTLADPPGEVIRMVDALSGKEVRPQPPEALVDQGRKGKFFALVKRAPVTAADEVQKEDGRETFDESADPLEAQNQLLDRQLFNVLMMAVKQSGLKISTDLIVQIRDNQFRKGDFHDAFEKLNQLATRYEMLAARRKEQLRQDDQWLGSGQSGLSMREVEMRRLKNANERTRLEHASHRFGLVVEPLRILSRGG